jgi:hypothetical protein
MSTIIIVPFSNNDALHIPSTPRDALHIHTAQDQPYTTRLFTCPKPIIFILETNKKIDRKILSHLKLYTYRTAQDQPYTHTPLIFSLPKNNYYPKQLTLPKPSSFPLHPIFSSLTLLCVHVFSLLIFSNTILPIIFL